MKRIAALAVALMLFAGCAKNEPADTAETPGAFDPGDMVRVTEVRVDDRLVTCIAWKRGYAGGLSCDWANAKPAAS